MENVKAKISLTSFIDFMITPDAQKVRKVREIKHYEYSRGKDYWLSLRECLVEVHSKGDISLLDKLLNETPKSRYNNYKNAIKGYHKFFKSIKEMDWFDPPKGYWVFENFACNVNPELGLYINGIPYLVKLYFKEDTTSAEIILHKARVSTIGYLMDETLRELCPAGTRMAVLNVKKGQLIQPEIGGKDTWIALKASVRHFIDIWDEV
jgi:hypothetical protein